AAERRRLLASVDARDAERLAREELRRKVAERGNDLRLDHLHLLPEPALARRDLVGDRVAIPRRPRLEDVGDVDVRARQTDAGEQRIEQLSRLADERDALLVLVEPRGLADEEEICIRAADAEDGPRSCRMQGTARAAGDLRLE